MHIAPHLLIDAVILSFALTITIVLRAKGNAAKRGKEGKWILKKASKNFKEVKLFKIYNCFIV